MIVSKSILDNAIPFPVPITNYRFRVADGVDPKEVARRLEASFLEHGMDTEVLEEELEKETAGARGTFRVFIGFMALTQIYVGGQAQVIHVIPALLTGLVVSFVFQTVKDRVAHFIEVTLLRQRYDVYDLSSRLAGHAAARGQL